MKIFIVMMAMMHPVVPVSKHKHIVIAHRGDHVLLPENTLAAYASAIRVGVDYIETDLRTTKKGDLVIRHGSLEELSDSEILKLPSFKDVLKLCRNKMKIYLDFKDADVSATYRMICAAGMEKQIVVYANTLEQLKLWNEVAPDMPMLTCVPDTVKSLTAFLDTYSIAGVDGSIGQYSEADLALFKNRGIAVWLDVQTREEGPEIWNKALKEGVPGMQTDHPAALVKYLKQQRLR
jgi:glycerophosphoryl diester phosphodiesterase